MYSAFGQDQPSWNPGRSVSDTVMQDSSASVAAATPAATSGPSDLPLVVRQAYENLLKSSSPATRSGVNRAGTPFQLAHGQMVKAGGATPSPVKSPGGIAATPSPTNTSGTSFSMTTSTTTTSAGQGGLDGAASSGSSASANSQGGEGYRSAGYSPAAAGSPGSFSSWTQASYSPSGYSGPSGASYNPAISAGVTGWT